MVLGDITSEEAIVDTDTSEGVIVNKDTFEEAIVDKDPFERAIVNNELLYSPYRCWAEHNITILDNYENKIKENKLKSIMMIT